MKVFALLPLAICLAACAGDNHVTHQSVPQSSRGFAPVSTAQEIRNPGTRDGQYSPNRIYRIERLQTADQPQGEWRANGGTIRQRGTDIEFTELGSGKTISFTGPHQVTATDAGSDRSTVIAPNQEQLRSDSPR